MEQHHREVVLTERMAALRGVPEVLPRLDVVAHQPGRCTLQDVRVRIGNGQWACAFDLCGGGTRAGQQQTAEKVAHDQTLGDGDVPIVSSMLALVVKRIRNAGDELTMRRIGAVMREQPLDPEGRLRLGGCVLDAEARELRTADDRPVELRPKALEVLLLLAGHAGRVVDKGTLMARVWPGVVVGDDSLTQTVVEIRRALGDHERQILCTVARRGYRLQSSVPSAAAMAPSLSVAVLPIAHDAGDRDGARWAAMLTSELTSRAGSSIPDSKVVARETVAAMGTALNDPRVAARQLGVQQVMCGELLAAGDGWSVALAVVDGASGVRRWSHRFALARPALPERIGQVAAQAARALVVEMHRTAAAAASDLPLSQRSADDLALQGWASLYDGLTPGNLERALELFERAVEKEPSHLRALGGVACISHCQAQFGWAPDREQTHRRAIETASRLATLHPDATLTALVRSDAADIEGRCELRLSICDRLCERDPGNPSVHAARACALLKLARFDECLAEIDVTRSLSVDDFRAGWWCASAACAHLMLGRHRLAATEAQQAIAANACLSLPPLLLAAALQGEGRSAEAREVLHQHMLREPQCDRAHAETLLGHGDVGYTQGCARILSNLEALGMPTANTSMQNR
jgi:adenylate cyclase